MVSAYLIPARGLKRHSSQEIQDRYRGFRISNPRKGTETGFMMKVYGGQLMFPHI